MKKNIEPLDFGNFQDSRIDSLFSLILEIPGPKILTLAVSGAETFAIDVDGRGIFGYSPSHKMLLYRQLERALHGAGALIIRQFLYLSVKRKLQNGKEMLLPEKNLYGISLSRGFWCGMSAENLQECFEIDAQTGKPLPREEGVHYKSLAMRSC